MIREAGAVSGEGDGVGRRRRQHDLDKHARPVRRAARKAGLLSTLA
jgi:hypothetical protein